MKHSIPLLLAAALLAGCGDRKGEGDRDATPFVTPELTVGWFHDVAVGTDYPLENGQRFEILATINPTETLKKARVF